MESSAKAMTTENEEFEFRLRMEKEQSAAKPDTSAEATFAVPSRPIQFNQDKTQPARMTNTAVGTRQVPVDSPKDRFLYEAGGRATDALTRLGMPPEAAAAGGYLTNLGGQIGTSFLGGNAGSKLEPAAQGLGRWLMQTAIKPTPADMLSGKGPKAIDYFLKEGMNPTEGGISALRQEGLDIANKVKDLIVNNKAMVPSAAVENKLLQLANDLEGGTHGVEKTKEVMGVLKTFLDHPSLAGGNNMTVQAAQKMKQLNYRELDDSAYGINVKTNTQTKALKDLTAELKTGIEKVAPEVVPLNARGSEIWNAIKVAERRSVIEGNKNPVPLAASFAMSAHNPGLTLGMWLNSTAWGKSMLARGIYSSADLGTPLGRFVGAAAGAHSGQSQQQ